MVVPFSPALHTLPTISDRCDRATWVALTAIGELTRLANDATTTEDAFRIHALANEVEAAALGAVGVAIDKAETLTRQA